MVSTLKIKQRREAVSFVLRSCNFKFGGEEGLIVRVSFEQRLTSEGASHVDI